MAFPVFRPCPLCGGEPVASWDVVTVYDLDEYDARCPPFRRQPVVAVRCDACGLRLERPTARVVAKAEHLAHMEGLAEVWNMRWGP